VLFQAHLGDPLGNAVKVLQEYCLVQATRLLFSIGNMWGACWEVCRQGSAILNLSGENGQGVLVGSVVE
jgi:hypothetical protein